MPGCCRESATTWLCASSKQADEITCVICARLRHSLRCTRSSINHRTSTGKAAADLEELCADVLLHEAQSFGALGRLRGWGRPQLGDHGGEQRVRPCLQHLCRCGHVVDGSLHGKAPAAASVWSVSLLGDNCSVLLPKHRVVDVYYHALCKAMSQGSSGGCRVTSVSGETGMIKGDHEWPF